MEDKGNKAEWKVYFTDSMLNWINPLKEDIKSDNKEPCRDGHFPIVN